MWSAASSDLIATHFQLGIEGVIHFLQALLFLGPVIAFVITKRICLGLQKKDRSILLHGYESGRIVRLPGGEYVEQRKPVDEFERWKLVNHSNYKPLVPRPGADGKIRLGTRVRAAITRFFFEDRIEPVAQKKLDEHDSKSHHAG